MAYRHHSIGTGVILVFNDVSPYYTFGIVALIMKALFRLPYAKQWMCIPLPLPSPSIESHLACLLQQAFITSWFKDDLSLPSPLYQSVYYKWVTTKYNKLRYTSIWHQIHNPESLKRMEERNFWKFNWIPITLGGKFHTCLKLLNLKLPNIYSILSLLYELNINKPEFSAGYQVSPKLTKLNTS